MAYFVSNQSGFCTNFSTNSCLVQLTNFNFRGIDKGFHTWMILFHRQKTCDMLRYTTLLQKMECIAFKESVINWFQSYLSNRKFFMTLEDVFWDAGLIIYIPYRWKRKPELILVGQIIGREKILVTTKKLVTFHRLFFTDKSYRWIILLYRRYLYLSSR